MKSEELKNKIIDVLQCLKEEEEYIEVDAVLEVIHILLKKMEYNQKKKMDIDKIIEEYF